MVAWVLGLGFGWSAGGFPFFLVSLNFYFLVVLMGDGVG